jgi:hypothetical protein
MTPAPTQAVPGGVSPTAGTVRDPESGALQNSSRFVRFVSGRL